MRDFKPATASRLVPYLNLEPAAADQLPQPPYFGWCLTSAAADKKTPLPLLPAGPSFPLFFARQPPPPKPPGLPAAVCCMLRARFDTAAPLPLPLLPCGCSMDAAVWNPACTPAAVPRPLHRMRDRCAPALAPPAELPPVPLCLPPAARAMQVSQRSPQRPCSHRSPKYSSSMAWRQRPLSSQYCCICRRSSRSRLNWACFDERWMSCSRAGR